MKWVCFTFCVAAILAAFFVRPASAEMVCFPNKKIAEREVVKPHGEKFIFSAAMAIGSLAHFYAGAQTITILIEQPNGMVCTGPALIGDIVKNAENTCA